MVGIVNKTAFWLTAEERWGEGDQLSKILHANLQYLFISEQSYVETHVQLPGVTQHHLLET